VKIFRGPSSKTFDDASHEEVSKIKSKDLQESIINKTSIQFNVTKNKNERQAICTAFFEDEDLIPLLEGVISRLKSQHQKIINVKKVLENTELSNDQKIAAAKQAAN